MNILSFFPETAKSPLRAIRDSWQDANQYVKYRLRCFGGQDIMPALDIQTKTVTVGRGDGKWAISPAHLSATPVVISIGVGCDISFDLDLIEKYEAHVYAFDPTPISLEWIATQTLPEMFHFTPMGVAEFNGKAEFSMPEGNAVSYSAVGELGGSRTISCDVNTLETILDSKNLGRVDILKMDIEGGEYCLIEDLVRLRPVVGQLLIEFHHRMFAGVDGLQRTQAAVNSLKAGGYKLFHISARGLEYSFL